MHSLLAFRREVGIGSSSHCLLVTEFKRSETSASEAAPLQTEFGVMTVERREE